MRNAGQDGQGGRLGWPPSERMQATICQICSSGIKSFHPGMMLAPRRRPSAIVSWIGCGS